MIMSDWKHLLPNHPEVHQMHDDLMNDLQQISDQVDALNNTVPCNNRPIVCQSFNPKFLETSVSV